MPRTAAAGAPDEAKQLNLWERTVAAATASVVSSVVVNPLDVVKTRMQARDAVPRSKLPTAYMLSHCTGWSQYAHQGAAVALPRQQPYLSALDGLVKIARTEGPHVLWRGTDAALLSSIPLVAIYFPAYDLLSKELSQSLGPSAYTPLLAGSLARVAATTAVCPLELIKTRMQAAATAGAPGRMGDVWRELQGEAAGRRLGMLRTLFRGLGATLIKDVPFAAIYWSVLEPVRVAVKPCMDGLARQGPLQDLVPRVLSLGVGEQPLGMAGQLLGMRSDDQQLATDGGLHLADTSMSGHDAHAPSWSQAQPQHQAAAGCGGTVPQACCVAEPPVELPPRELAAPQGWAEVLAVNAVAGTVAGFAAAGVTQPMDVVKTRMQVAGADGAGLGFAGMAKRIVRREGAQALFTGFGPRTARTAAAYAILMSSYEIWKCLLVEPAGH